MSHTANAELDDRSDHLMERTIREWADIAGRKPDSVMKTIRRKIGAGQYTLDSPMSADQFNGLFSSEPAAAVVVRAQKKTRNQKPANTNPQSPTPKPKSNARSFNQREAILYILMAIPAVASVQNMYSVTGDIAAHLSTAILLTGLFSATPFLFVLAGMRSRWTKALTGLMIAYECFANFVRIYGGLTGFGGKGFPTRFLGLVTDIFAFYPLHDENGVFTGYKYQAGTHETAIVLAAIMAAMAAAVFYTAYYELNKKQ